MTLAEEIYQKEQELASLRRQLPKGSDLRAERKAVAYAFEAQRIRETLIAADGVVMAASRRLGMSSTHFYQRCKLVGVNVAAVRAELAR